MKDVGGNIAIHQIRYDLEIIAGLIKPKSRVLDIGCGDGELLKFLSEKKQVDGCGLEISQDQVGKALQNRLSVIQGDAEEDLAIYPDLSFDYAILSQTIQATRNPVKILQEMLRISHFAIISLPNFAYFKNRFHLLLKGEMPVSKTIPFQWYETPNIHFCSIQDFLNLCQKMSFAIEKQVFLTSTSKIHPILRCSYLANFFAEFGIFLVAKNHLKASGQEETAIKPLKYSSNLKAATC